jgi:O-antigen/teichoic acid export membrane protein
MSELDVSALAGVMEPQTAETQESVRRRRDWHAVKTGVVGVAVQVVSYAIRLVVIPLSIQMLGGERYGLWLVVGSLVAWGGAADLGLAPGLVNLLATAHGRGDRDGMRRVISTAFAAYGVLSAVLAALAVGASRWGRLPGLLGAREAGLADSARLLVVVCGLIFAVSMLTRVVNTTSSALQEGYLGSYASLAGSLMGLGLLFGLARNRGGLLSYAFVVSVPPLVAQMGLAVYLFGWRHRDLRPGLGWCDIASLRRLWAVGAPLMVYQLSTMAILYSANLLIANRLGAGEVVRYSVPYAAYAVINGIVWLLVSPYLPALTEASLRRDWAWVQTRSKQALLIGVGLTAAGCCAVIVAGDWLIKTWTRGSVHPSLGLLVGLSFFSVLAIGSSITGLWLQGLTLVRQLAWIYGATTSLTALIAWAILPNLGIVAIPICFGLGAGVQILANLHVWLKYIRSVRPLL